MNRQHISCSETDCISEMEPSSTLFADLTDLDSTPPFAATNFVRQLITVIAANVCFCRRNNQVLYRLVEHARNLCNEIQKLIADAEVSGNLDVFETYTEAIDQLERFVWPSSQFVLSCSWHTLSESILFDFAPVLNSEHTQYLGTPTSIEECVSFIGGWENNRRRIRIDLSRLRSENTLMVLYQVNNS